MSALDELIRSALAEGVELTALPEEQRVALLLRILTAYLKSRL